MAQFILSLDTNRWGPFTLYALVRDGSPLLEAVDALPPLRKDGGFVG